MFMSFYFKVLERIVKDQRGESEVDSVLSSVGLRLSLFPLETNFRFFRHHDSRFAM